MKILYVVDSPVWAIGKLTNAICEVLKHHETKIHFQHPKELRKDLDKGKEAFAKVVCDFLPDVIHFQYWGLAQYLKNEPCTEKIKKILTHHNQKNLLECPWDGIDQHVVHTEKAKTILTEGGYENVRIIRHGIDRERYPFVKELDRGKKIGYVGRVVAWKGLESILKVADTLNRNVVGMGRVDDRAYWDKCLEYSDRLEMRLNVEEIEKQKIFEDMGVYVGNSRDGIEEGTLCLLEAMASGVPVVTTPSGTANDIIKDGENGIIIEFESEESLQSGLTRYYEMSEEAVNRMREKAWDTVRNLSEMRMALNYERAYYETIHGKKDLASVIIPTCDRLETIGKIVRSYERQTYRHLEIVVVDDGKKTSTSLIRKAIGDVSVPVKIIATDRSGYGLAQARNLGIIESRGHYLIFSDDRFLAQPDVVERFVERLKTSPEKTCVFGYKGYEKKHFVENFFAVRKRDIVTAGMFCERINRYGGMSEEIRTRLLNQEFNLLYAPEVKCEAIRGTHSRTEKRYELARMKDLLWKLYR